MLRKEGEGPALTEASKRTIELIKKKQELQLEKGLNEKGELLVNLPKNDEKDMISEKQKESFKRELSNIPPLPK